jgi:hypothetical protein
MNRCLAIAVLIAQMTAGVCMLTASGHKGAMCASCCEHLPTPNGAMSCACCRIALPTLPALEASGPFTVTAPPGPALFINAAVLPPNIAKERPASFGECFCDTSPPRLYLRNSALLI